MSTIPGLYRNAAGHECFTVSGRTWTIRPVYYNQAGPPCFLAEGPETPPGGSPHGNLTGAEYAVKRAVVKEIAARPRTLVDFVVRGIYRFNREDTSPMFDLLTRSPLWCLSFAETYRGLEWIDLVRAFHSFDCLWQNPPTPDIEGLTAEAWEKPLPALLILRDAMGDAGIPPWQVNYLLKFVDDVKQETGVM